MIVHFYHLYCDGLWGPILDEHISALKNSEFISKINAINIGLVGTEKNRNEAIKIIDGYDIEFNIVVSEESGFEQVTLIELHKSAISNKNNFYLYCHSKGSSICETEDVCSLSDEARHRVARKEVIAGNFSNCSDANSAWRRNMTKNLVMEWQRCVDFLADGYDSVGCYLNYQRIGGNFYWGNFWWAKGSLLASLEPPSNESRYLAEKWLFSNYHKYQHKFKNLTSENMFQLR